MSSYRAKKKKQKKTSNAVTKLFNEGIKYESELKYVKAIECFKRALRINAKSKFLWQNLAFSYFDIRSKNNAIKALKQAEKLDQSDEYTLITLKTVKFVKISKLFWLISLIAIIVVYVIVLVFNLKHPDLSDFDVILFFILPFLAFTFVNCYISLSGFEIIFELRDSLRKKVLSNYELNLTYYHNFKKIKRGRTILNIFLISIFIIIAIYLCISIYFF